MNGRLKGRRLRHQLQPLPSHFSLVSHGPMRGSRTLTDLPVELLYELYILALSPSLPLASKYIYTAIKTGSAVLHAHYILGRHSLYFCHSEEGLTCISGKFLTPALRYPICSIQVLDALHRILDKTTIPDDIPDASFEDFFELPRRIFRSLDPTMIPVYGPNSEPLPLLRFLWQKAVPLRTSVATKPTIPFTFMKPFVNSYKGYPLFRAVHAGFPSLVQFLLDRGADPRLRSYAAVKAAILARDLEMVKLLVECEPELRPGSSKKRKRSDRLVIDTSLVDLAIRKDAREIVEYFISEKGCVPEMKSLRHI